MYRWLLLLVSLSFAAPAAAQPRLRLQQPTSLFSTPPLVDVDEAPLVKAPGWLVADARQPTAEPGDSSGGAVKKKKKKKKKDVAYGIGLTGRGIFVPFWFLEMFLDAGTALYSGAIGAEFVRRKGNFDLVASINFNFYSPPDGNFQGNGKPPLDIDYIRFDGLNVLSFEVDFIWHHNFNHWLSLVYGAGLGFGVVLGDVLRMSVHGGRLGDAKNSPICHNGNAGDLDKCNPTEPGSTDEAEWKADREKWLDKQQDKMDQCGGGDGPEKPCMFVEDDVWPVVPIVHLLIGLNFKVTNELNIRVTGGWHDAFYVGVTTQWFFF